MNISKIPNISFTANTTINAPQSLLNNADKEYLLGVGSKIGTNKDQISITLGNLEQNSENQNVQSYKLHRKARFVVGNKIHILDNTKTVPYIMNGKINPHAEPKTYLTKIFKELVQQYNLLSHPIVK
jgi:hypothetical protein